MRLPENSPLKRIAHGVTNISLALSLVGCSGVMVAKEDTSAKTEQVAKETPCSEKAIIKGEPSRLVRNGNMTMGVYNVNALDRSARILLAVEPGVMPTKPSGLGSSETAIDVTAIVEPSNPYPRIGFDYKFDSDQGDNTFRSFDALVPGYSKDDCNLVELTIINRMPTMKINGKRIVTSGTPA